MLAKVICMASAKGGSGKTVLTATFCAFLLALGKKVLMIDTDAATNGLSLLYLKETMMRAELAASESRQPRGIYEITSSEHEPEIVILSTGVQLIPATYGFANTEGKSLEKYQTALKVTLEHLRESYDYIFLDAQAGTDLYAHAAMKRGISDEVIIVSEYDPMSAAGIERLKGLFREDLNYVRTWVLLNKMLPDFVKSFSDFMEVAKYLSPIPWDADVVRAYARRKLALNLEEGNEHTLAVMQTLKSLLGDDIKPDLDKWARDKTAAIRKPIVDQYHDLEKQLDMLMHQDSHRNLWVTIQQFSFVMIAALVLIFIYSIIRTTSGSDVPLRLTAIINSMFSSLLGSTFFLCMSIAGIFSVMLFRARYGFDKESSRLRRQREILEEKLKKMQMLQDADFETLIRRK